MLLHKNDKLLHEASDSFIEEDILPLEGLCLKSICSGVLCASDDLPLSPTNSKFNLTTNIKHKAWQ